jgi:hypothetical protein
MGEMGTLLLKDEGVARAHLVHRLDQLSGEEWTPRMRGARGPRTYIRSTITTHSSRLVFASSSPSLSEAIVTNTNRQQLALRPPKLKSDATRN